MSPLRILVVEDYAPFRRLMCSLLEQHDFQIVGEASDGLQAVHMAEKLQPDLITLDIGLPGLNGLDVAERARRIAPHARIVFVSQESSSALIGDILRLGSPAYVHKPRVHSDLLPRDRRRSWRQAIRQRRAGTWRRPRRLPRTWAPVLF